jgi:hypothetical protein
VILTCTYCQMKVDAIGPSPSQCPLCGKGRLVKKMSKPSPQKADKRAFFCLVQMPRGSVCHRHTREGEDCYTIREAGRWVHECNCGLVLLDWLGQKE